MKPKNTYRPFFEHFKNDKKYSKFFTKSNNNNNHKKKIEEGRPSRKEREYMDFLDEIGVPEHDHPESGGRVPWNMVDNYGMWLYKNDQIAFNVGFQEWEAESRYRR